MSEGQKSPQRKSLCITFAGPPGSSKTPIAYYLSWNLGLPIFNNDGIRTEVQEDRLKTGLETDLYYRRRDERLTLLLSSGCSFIYDASIDRRYAELDELLQKYHYSLFIISLNLSAGLLAKMASAKGYSRPPALVNRWGKEHEEFWKVNQDRVDCVITDDNFPNRLVTALRAVQGKVG